MSRQPTNFQEGIERPVYVVRGPTVANTAAVKKDWFPLERG